MVTLSNKQYESLIGLIKLTINEAIDKKLDRKLDAKLRYLPSKNDIAKLSKEIRDLREEVTVHNKQVSRNYDEIEKLKVIHPSYSHS